MTMSDFSPYSCPRCGGRMQIGRAPDAVLHACGRCGGIWIDNAATRRVVEGKLSEDAQRLARAVDVHPAPTIQSDAYRQEATQDRGRPRCPVCGDALVQVLTDEARHGIAGVQLDVCPAHGTWFDRRELHVLAQSASIRDLAKDYELEADMLSARFWAERNRRGTL